MSGIVLPTDQPVALLKYNYFNGNIVDLGFRFDKPIQSLQVFGDQVAGASSGSPTFQLFEGMGAGPISDWVDVGGSTYPFTVGFTLTSPGYNGCGRYILRLGATPTGSAYYDLYVLGISV